MRQPTRPDCYMDSSDLQKLAERARSMREASSTLILASCLLTLLFFLPFLSGRASPPAQAPLTATPTPGAFARVSIEAQAAIVYDFATGETLYAAHPDAQLPLASLTKLLTVYAALTTLSPQTPITIPASATRLEEPRVFSAGQTFTLSDLARLTLTASLNDGAAAIAETVSARGHSTESEALASAAAALNLSQTYAINGSGLDVNAAISGGYGSARDLARLAGVLATQAPSIAEATTLPFAHAVSAGGTAFKVSNTDPIIATIPHILLSKTGYTDLAGGNLAFVFDIGIGHPIAVVVLGSSKHARFTDGTTLVRAAIAHFAGVESL